MFGEMRQRNPYLTGTTIYRYPHLARDPDPSLVMAFQRGWAEGCGVGAALIIVILLIVGATAVAP